MQAAPSCWAAAVASLALLAGGAAAQPALAQKTLLSASGAPIITALWPAELWGGAHAPAESGGRIWNDAPSFIITSLPSMMQEGVEGARPPAARGSVNPMPDASPTHRRASRHAAEPSPHTAHDRHPPTPRPVRAVAVLNHHYIEPSNVDLGGVAPTIETRTEAIVYVCVEIMHAGDDCGYPPRLIANGFLDYDQARCRL